MFNTVNTKLITEKTFWQSLVYRNGESSQSNLLQNIKSWEV